MKKQRFSLFLEFLVQFIWIVFLIRILLPREGGSYAALFLSPDYFWLLYISIAFFLLFMFVTLYKLFSTPPGKPLKNAFLYLLIPVIFFPIAKNTRLGSSSVNRRNIESILTESDTAYIDEESINSPFSYLNTDGTTRITDILSLDDSFLGTEVEISGIAEFNDILPDGSFYLYRFIIFCCAADATPAGLIIYGVDSGSIVKNRWYRLRGRVSLFNVEGKEYIAIEADSINEIEEPANPYEYY